MAPLSPSLSPQALRAYGTAQGIARAIEQPAAQPFSTAAPDAGQATADPKPAAGAKAPPDAPVFSLKTLSTFAGLLVGEQETAEIARQPDVIAPEPVNVAEPRAASSRPLAPGSTLDLKV
jgi:hypothetical protein